MKNRIKYIVTLSFELGSMVNEVREIENSLNNSLSTWGINDKVKIRSHGLKLTMYCDREIIKQEKDAMKELIEFYANKTALENVIVESIRKARNQPCIRKSL